MNTRRQLLASLLLGTASFYLPGTALAQETSFRTLFSPIMEGDETGLGWKLVRIYAPTEGAITLNLVTPGKLAGTWRAARVDVVLRQGAPKGPAWTEELDFLVMDGGDGEQELEESLGRVLRRMAALAQENINSWQSSAELTALLTTLEERQQLHPDSMSAASSKLQPGPR